MCCLVLRNCVAFNTPIDGEHRKRNVPTSSGASQQPFHRGRRPGQPTGDVSCGAVSDLGGFRYNGTTTTTTNNGLLCFHLFGSISNIMGCFFPKNSHGPRSNGTRKDCFPSCFPLHHDRRADQSIPLLVENRVYRS